VEGLEQPLAILITYPRTVVRDRHAHGSVISQAHMDVDPSLFAIGTHDSVARVQ